MSITVKDQPETFAPVYNNNVWSVSSDNSGNTNFRFVADIHVSGVTGFTRLKADADPDFAFGVFDVGRIIESFVNENQLFDINLTDNGFQVNDAVRMRYDIKFGEEYDVAGTLTVFPDLTVVANNFGFNAVFDFNDFVDYVKSDFLIDTVSSKFLTNMPNPLTTYPDEKRWIGMMYDTNNQAHRLQVKTYDGSDAGGSLIQTVNIDNALVDPSNPFDQFVRVDIGDNLNDIPSGDLSAGAQPIITTSVLSYTIQMIDSSAAVSSELRTINIDRDECSRFTTLTFHFLNKPGQFDTISLFLRSDEVVNIQKTEFRQRQGRLNSDGTFTYDKQQAGVVSTSTRLSDRITVNSIFLTENEKTWLEEFVTSPKILQEKSGELFAVNPLVRTFEKDQDENADLFNLVFTFEPAFKRTRQRY